MKAFIPYLNFDGNTREAMTFYKDCMGAGAELSMPTFGEAQGAGKEMADRIMHARLSGDTMVLMASDTMPQTPFTVDNNVWITQDCESVEEIDRLFAASVRVAM
ncbi:MAG: VOC family protein [Gemmatimonas sp.]